MRTENVSHLAPVELIERIAIYIESESECPMAIVVDETKHDYGLRLLRCMADELIEKFSCLS